MDGNTISSGKGPLQPQAPQARKYPERKRVAPKVGPTPIEEGRQFAANYEDRFKRPFEVPAAAPVPAPALDGGLPRGAPSVAAPAPALETDLSGDGDGTGRDASKIRSPEPVEGPHEVL